MKFQYGWREELLYQCYKFIRFYFRWWWCDRCKRFTLGVKSRRMSTYYVDDKENYTTTCHSCFLEIEEEWQELWDEYYSSRL